VRAGGVLVDPAVVGQRRRRSDHEMDRILADQPVEDGLVG
jgi:hypothetical protein